MSESTSSSSKIPISFTGHDTFPLRHGWLEKAYYMLDKNDKNPFSSDDAIVKLGVGKNMVNAIKHWAIATNFIERNENGLTASSYAQHLLEEDVDPFLENIGTIWKIHYELCKKTSNTTAYWIFSHLNNPDFNRDDLELKLREFAIKSGKIKSSKVEAGLKSIKPDINVVLAMYCRARTKKGGKEEDILSPLAELNLVRRTGDNRYTLNTGLKKTLPQGLFIASIVDFWENKDQQSGKTSNSIRVDRLLYDPLSPGRIFILSEHELTDRLRNLPLQTDGALELSETSGILQITKKQDKFNATKLLAKWAEK